MTDYKETIALFKRFGVEHVTQDTPAGPCILLYQGMKKVAGHYMLYLKFSYDLEEGFIEVGAYEE